MEWSEEDLARLAKGTQRTKQIAENKLTSKSEIIRLLTDHGYGLQYVSDEFKNDEDVVRAAISLHEYNFKYASKNLQDSEEFITKYVRHKGGIQYASERIRDNKDVMLKIMGCDSSNYEFISDNLKYDYEILIEMIHTPNFAGPFVSPPFYLAPDEVKRDRNFILYLIDDFKGFNQERLNKERLLRYAFDKKFATIIFNYLDDSIFNDYELMLKLVSIIGEGENDIDDRYKASIKLLKESHKNDFEYNMEEYSREQEKINENGKYYPDISNNDYAIYGDTYYDFHAKKAIEAKDKSESLNNEVGSNWQLEGLKEKVSDDSKVNKSRTNGDEENIDMDNISILIYNARNFMILSLIILIIGIALLIYSSFDGLANKIGFTMMMFGLVFTIMSLKEYLYLSRPSLIIKINKLLAKIIVK